LSEKKIIDSTIDKKDNNGLKVFGIIMAYILLFIVQLQSKIKNESLLKEKGQIYNLEGENDNE